MSKLDDVAKLAGVSKSTVSRVINNGPSISDKTRQKVNEALARLNFSAQQLKRSSVETKMIGVILSLGRGNAQFGFVIDIVFGAENKAFENDYMMLVGDSSTSETKEQSLVISMLNRDVEGLILLSRSNENNEHLALLKNSGVPFVLVDQMVNNMQANIVRGDNLTSSIHLMNHLFSMGHRDIAMISPSRYSTYADRIRGYQISMMEKNYKVPEHFLIEIQDPEADTYAAMHQLLSAKSRPSAIFFSSPLSLGACIRAAEEYNIRIPEDLSVVVFDDTYSELPSAYRNFFTAVNQSGKLIGGMAIELLFQQIKNPGQNPQEIVIPGTLNIRKSVTRMTTA